MNAVQLLVTFAVFLVLFCAAGPILGIYGPDFVAGAISLQILAATWLLRSSLGPQEMLLNIAGRERTVTMVHVLAVVLSLVFSLALVPMYGITGAAIAHAIAWGGTGVLLYQMVVRKLGLRVAFHHLLGAWLRERIGHGNFATRPLKAMLEPVLMAPPVSPMTALCGSLIAKSMGRCSHRPMSQEAAEYALQEILVCRPVHRHGKGTSLVAQHPDQGGAWRKRAGRARTRNCIAGGYFDPVDSARAQADPIQRHVPDPVQSIASARRRVAGLAK